jgi:hypothetical protein
VILGDSTICVNSQYAVSGGGLGHHPLWSPAPGRAGRHQIDRYLAGIGQVGARDRYGPAVHDHFTRPILANGRDYPRSCAPHWASRCDASRTQMPGTGNGR